MWKHLEQNNVCDYDFRDPNVEQLTSYYVDGMVV